MVLKAAVMLALLANGASLSAKPFQYAEGQIWEYRTRPQDPGSLLKIQKIDTDPSRAEHRVIYHVSIIAVHLGDPNVLRAISQVPLARESLDDSVIRISPNRLGFPDPWDGIAEWRKAKGGVFTITVDKIVDIVEQQISKMPKQPEPFYP